MAGVLIFRHVHRPRDVARFAGAAMLLEQYLVKRRGLTLAKLKDEAQAVRAHPRESFQDALNIVEAGARLRYA